MPKIHVSLFLCLYGDVLCDFYLYCINVCFPATLLSLVLLLISLRCVFILNYLDLMHRILDNLPVAVLRQRRDGSQSTTYEHGFRVGFKGNYAGVCSGKLVLFSKFYVFLSYLNHLYAFAEQGGEAFYQQPLELQGHVSQGYRD